MLRVWVVSQDYTADVRISEAMMTQLAEAYRKIRNTFRFALCEYLRFRSCARFRGRRRSVGDGRMDASAHRERSSRECREWYDKFEFHRVYHALHDFCTVDLSSFYFDVLKDRLYTFAPKNRGRRSAQTAVYRIASALLRLIAPILVFTAEEVWKYLPRAAAEPESVHMAMFPAAEELERALDEARAKNWDRLLTVREEVLKAMEPVRAAKTISSGLEARVTLAANGELADAAAASTRPICRHFSSSRKWKSPSAPRTAAHAERHRRLADSRRARARQKMRALLELFHARRRKRGLSHRVRTLRRRAERN